MKARFYKIRCGGHRFVASIQENEDMYRVKYGGA